MEMSTVAVRPVQEAREEDHLFVNVREVACLPPPTEAQPNHPLVRHTELPQSRQGSSCSGPRFVCASSHARAGVGHRSSCIELPLDNNDFNNNLARRRFIVRVFNRHRRRHQLQEQRDPCIFDCRTLRLTAAAGNMRTLGHVSSPLSIFPVVATRARYAPSGCATARPPARARHTPSG